MHAPCRWALMGFLSTQKGLCVVEPRSDRHLPPPPEMAGRGQSTSKGREALCWETKGGCREGLQKPHV